MAVKPVIVKPGEGASYPWSQDIITVKARRELSGGRVTLAEDSLKPNFHLSRHHHKKMAEIFYILEGEVEFKFDDEAAVVAAKGWTVTVPMNCWHEVKSREGARMLTIFTPGGFDEYLEKLVACTEAQYADPLFMKNLAEAYDIFNQ